MVKNFISNGLENIPGGFYICRADESGEILFINKKAMKLFECENAGEFNALTGNSFWGMICSDDREVTIDALRNQIYSKSNKREAFEHVEYRIKTRSGKTVYTENYGELADDPEEGKLFYVFIIDTRMRSNPEETDRLTELPGMHRFLEFVNNALESNCRSSDTSSESIVFLNTIGFKLVNAKYGIEEGDNFLKTIARILNRKFQDAFIARFADDHFAMYTCEKDSDIITGLRQVHDEVAEIRPELHVEVKAGIYHIQKEDTSAGIVSDCAKIASDSIKQNVDEFYRIYTPELSRHFETSIYASENIDNAIKQDHIKVYYQPVIRTSTGNVCGMEALARWDDPEYGLLSPGVFIGALEESRQISKLDTFMIGSICHRIRECMDRHNAVVPVSFNLSRMDFITTDVFEVVEDAVKRNNIPRENIHVEITETMLVSDAESVSRDMDRFHEAGYQVWMDDFGSGYSSLNVLKDYKFDVLKIDMTFLSSFTEKSKAIISSIVDMAKKIGVQTLAEGIETKEQYEFLREIGCEKVQGYFFGRPRPCETTLIDESGGMKTVEPMEWHDYYDAIGRVNEITKMPTAVIEYNGRSFHFLSANAAYKCELGCAGTSSIAAAEENMNSQLLSLVDVFREFTEGPVSEGSEQSITYPVNSSYLRASVKLVAKHGSNMAYRVNLANITQDENKIEKTQLDSTLRNLYALFDEVYLHDVTENTTLVILSPVMKVRNRNNVKGISENLKLYADKVIFSEDRERFMEFSKLSTLGRRIEEDGKGFTSDYFRTLDKNGNYLWKEHAAMLVPRQDSNQILTFCRRTAINNSGVAETMYEILKHTHFEDLDQ